MKAIQTQDLVRSVSDTRLPQINVTEYSLGADPSRRLNIYAGADVNAKFGQSCESPLHGLREENEISPYVAKVLLQCEMSAIETTADGFAVLQWVIPHERTNVI